MSGFSPFSRRFNWFSAWRVTLPFPNCRLRGNCISCSRGSFSFTIQVVQLLSEKLLLEPSFFLYPESCLFFRTVDRLDSFLRNFPEFPNAFLVGGAGDFLVIELTDQVKKQRLCDYMQNILSGLNHTHHSSNMLWCSCKNWKLSQYCYTIFLRWRFFKVLFLSSR